MSSFGNEFWVISKPEKNTGTKEIPQMKLVKVEIVAPSFDMNEAQIYRAIRENTFPFPHAVVRIGRQIRIDLDACERALQQQADHPLLSGDRERM
jgi:predicted DNA-binding transcriptional regulator AlpA